jgi:hypothetical protein
MLAHSFRSRRVAVLATLAMVACASSTPSVSQSGPAVSRVQPLTPTSRVIDAARIARSGSQTALDAVRAFVPSHRLMDAGPLTAVSGQSGSSSRGPLRVVVDGHPVADVESLRTIPAREVIAIHVLSAADATIRFGSSYTGGAIVLQTRASFRRVD